MPVAHQMSDVESDPDDIEASTSVPSRKLTKEDVLATVEEICGGQDDDVEVWMVKVPASLDPNKLHDLEIGSEETRVTCDSLTFAPEVTKKKSKVVLCGLNKKAKPVLAKVTLRGEVTFSETVEKVVVKEEDLLVQPVEPVEQPKGLVSRHPILGRRAGGNAESASPTKAQKRRKESESVEQEESPVKKKKKSKKNKKAE